MRDWNITYKKTLEHISLWLWYSRCTIFALEQKQI